MFSWLLNYYRKPDPNGGGGGMPIGRRGTSCDVSGGGAGKALKGRAPPGSAR